MTVQEILEGVKGLTVLELSELVKAFEEELVFSTDEEKDTFTSMM